jgi:hypothetical protein
MKNQKKMAAKTDAEIRKLAKAMRRGIGGNEFPPEQDIFRARVNETEPDARDRHGADKWGQFVARTPLDRAYGKFIARGSCWLGQDETEVLRRYRAGRLWFRKWNMAQGLGYDATLREAVDGGGYAEGGINARLQASTDRMRISRDEPRLTAKRFGDLDAVCGVGLEPGEHGRNTGRDAKTVKESVIAGLEVIIGYSPWQRHLEAETVLAIRPAA